jgi:hypothetical protein
MIKALAPMSSRARALPPPGGAFAGERGGANDLPMS